MAFAAECAFDGMHVFQYSRRSGTAASRMDRHIPERVKKERSARLRLMAEAGQRELVKRSLEPKSTYSGRATRTGSGEGYRIRTSGCIDRFRLRSGVLEKRRVSAAYRDGVWVRFRRVGLQPGDHARRAGLVNSDHLELLYRLTSAVGPT